VQQFVQGEADGPVPFHFNAPDYQNELIKDSSTLSKRGNV